MSWRLMLKPYVPALFVAVALVGSTAAAFAYIHRLQSLTAGTVLENLTGLRNAYELEFDLRGARSILYQYAIFGEQVSLTTLDSQHAEFEASLHRIRQLAVHDDEQRKVDEIEHHYREYLDGIEELQALGDEQPRRELAGQLTALLTRTLVPRCHDLVEQNAASIEAGVEAHRAITVRLQFVLVLAGFLVPLAGVFAGYLLSRGVTRQLARSREELLRAEQLAAVGHLAAGMAHELRNPLTSIKLMVQTASDDEPADLEVIEDEVRRMERTIQACLDFARPSQPQRCTFDLREAVGEACRLVEGRVRRQRLELSVAAPDAPLPVSADRHQIHQVLVNLLINAIDSAGPRGRLGVTVGEDAHELVLSVWDQGPGIPAALLPAIFEPFVSSKETGTGLGLSISRQIVEGHGGRIEARNRPEGGAELTVRLPRYGEPLHAYAAGRRRRTEHPARVPQGVPG